MKKNKTPKNELKEIYRNNNYTPISKQSNDGKAHFSIHGAMLGSYNMDLNRAHFLNRHIFSSHEGECFYLQINCDTDAKEFRKKWEHNHQILISTKDKQDYTNSFELELILPRHQKQVAFIRISSPTGLNPFFGKQLSVSLVVGTNYELCEIYPLAVCEFEPAMLELNFLRGSFTYASEPSIEYVSFRCGDDRAITLYAVCAKPAGFDYAKWEQFLEFSMTMTNEQGEVVYQTVDEIIKVTSPEADSQKKSEYLVASCIINDISRQAEGVYTCVIKFMGETQYVMEFTIDKVSKQGHLPSKINPHEAKKITKQPEEDAMSKLDALIGLENIKSSIKANLNYVTLMNARKKAGFPTGNRILHMICTGNPGTGKTTVCRLLGSLLKEVGILSKGHVIEANRESLLGQFIGETEKRTKSMIDKATGGILFIDEAYSLMLGELDSGRDYGRHVIDTLMPVLSDPESDLIVVLAGYGNEMSILLDSNPGLASRFPIRYNFADYTPSELMQIAMHYFETNRFQITDEAQERLYALMEQAVKIPNFGNGRYVKTLIENTILHNMANRIVSAGEDLLSDIDIICRIEACDIPTESGLNAKPVRRPIGFHITQQ